MRREGCLETAAIALFALLLGAFGMSTWMRHAESGGSERVADPVRAEAPPSVRSRIRIEVRNGVGEPGAAQSMTSFLRDLGFDVVDYGNAESFDHERTVILAHGDEAGPARVVGASLPGVPIRGAEDSSPYVDVTVILGADLHRVLADARANARANARVEPPSEGWWDRFTGWLTGLRGS